MNSALTRGYFYMSRGRWEDALKEFERVEMSHPLDHRLLKLMSACLRELGRLDEALARLEKARVIRPDDLKLLSSRSIRF
jgi:tetratricopeptide (TPR) repeat protein